MPNNNPPFGRTVTDDTETLGRSVAERARQATESMTDVVKDAARRIDDRRSTAADGLDSAAATIHGRAGDLPGGARVQELAHAAADRLTTGADYVRSHDAQRMMSDVETMVKNNPGPALVFAAAFGFILGRALTRD